MTELPRSSWQEEVVAGWSSSPLKKALSTVWSGLPSHLSQEPPSCLWMVLMSGAEGRSVPPLLRGLRSALGLTPRRRKHVKLPLGAGWCFAFPVFRLINSQNKPVRERVATVRPGAGNGRARQSSGWFSLSLSFSLT